MAVNMSYPKPISAQAKLFEITRSMTTGTKVGVLPKGAVIMGIYVLGDVASNAGTSATIGLGTTATANELMTGYDVKTAATGEGYSAAGAAAVGTALASRLTSNATIYGIYAETGTASSAGGSWWIKVEYGVVGPGEQT